MKCLGELLGSTNTYPSSNTNKLHNQVLKDFRTSCMFNYRIWGLQMTCEKTPTLYCDRQRTFHIASIGFDEVVPYIRIDHITDIFTKAFHPANFHRLLSKLGLLDIHRPHLEGVGQDIYVKSQ
ncbi:hypothetical protein MTR_5g038740 [Medicago truncatula]|uniref:Uncharacterized protein n=1 Tax=Medicago truncatula TaxID=3880 RepID=G7KB35_MEDTR|nr:hypothetical protein MTR_5g038740 [Medicago truncatula]